MTKAAMQRFERWFIPEPMSGCWLWLGRVSVLGYGGYKLNRRMEQAHRAAWLLYRGVIPDGLGVLHKCDVRCCVNPSHPFLGTQKDNMQDAASKGRTADAGGENNGRARLTFADVQFIKNSPESHSSLARKFGVTPTAICMVRKGKTWKTKQR